MSTDTAAKELGPAPEEWYECKEAGKLMFAPSFRYCTTRADVVSACSTALTKAKTLIAVALKKLNGAKPKFGSTPVKFFGKCNKTKVGKAIKVYQDLHARLEGYDGNTKRLKLYWRGGWDDATVTPKARNVYVDDLPLDCPTKLGPLSYASPQPDVAFWFGNPERDNPKTEDEFFKKTYDHIYLGSGFKDVTATEAAGVLIHELGHAICGLWDLNAAIYKGGKLSGTKQVSGIQYLSEATAGVGKLSADAIAGNLCEMLSASGGQLKHGKTSALVAKVVSAEGPSDKGGKRSLQIEKPSDADFTMNADSYRMYALYCAEKTASEV